MYTGPISEEQAISNYKRIFMCLLSRQDPTITGCSGCPDSNICYDIRAIIRKDKREKTSSHTIWRRI